MKRLIFCGIVLISLFVFGCSDCPSEEKTEEKTYKTFTGENGQKFGAFMFPEGATNIKKVGPYWYEFTYEGKRFLYKKNYHNSALTELRE